MSLPQDPNKPESIVVQAFTGLKNTVGAERLQISELERAINIDLDDVGQAKRRRGYTQKIAGNFHSAHTAPSGRTLVVKDGVLGVLREGYTFQSLGSFAGADRLSYADVGEETFFSSRSASGVVDSANGVNPWGQTGGSGTWVSPVQTPTDTLGSISGKLLGPPPLATEIAAYRGRIWMAAGKMLWATELYLYHYVDRTRTFFQLEADILMLAPVEDGIYVATETNVYFLRGNQLTEMRLEPLMTARVAPGSLVRAPVSSVHPDARQGNMTEGEAVVFLTDAGICAGMPGGRLYNLTSGTMEFPTAIQAAGLLRDEGGYTSYIASMDSGGTPSASAALGDYVDAEIIRFQG